MTPGWVVVLALLTVAYLAVLALHESSRGPQ